MSRHWPTALAGWLLLITAADARQASSSPPTNGWTASWGSSQMVPEGENVLPADRAANVTLRQVVRLSAGGNRIRLRLSNAFGTRPLTIGAAHVALASAPGTAAIVGGERLTFAGGKSAVIPAGAEIYSDPATLAVRPGADLAISLYLADAASPQTGHPGARATSFVLAGEHVADRTLAGATTTTRWYAIADVEVEGGAGTLVAIGDSITDGYGVKPERNSRWTDVLARRLRGDAATRDIGLVNAGIGGNRVLLDGLGPNLLARFDRDVIARSGVRWAIVLEGVNDLGVLTRDAPATPAQHAAIVAQVIAGYRQIVARAHAHGIKVIGGTIMPFVGNDYYHAGAETEADRQAINRFIRSKGAFDAVIDFDRIMRDPARPDRLLPAYDSGDHLHPSEAGYKVMGEAVPLTLFADGAIAFETGPTIALTFDDIPVHGPMVPGETRRDVVGRIAGALAAANAPALGFLNASVAPTDATDGEAAIAAWRAAGLPIGNHGFTHANLDTVGAAAFADDIVRNEAKLAQVAGDTDWHWFRYPYLAEGRDPVARDAVRRTLKARGYRIAAVTMGFADYNWNEPYARCVAKRDKAGLAMLETAWLADARTAVLSSRARAKAQLGRDIPYVLLMHVGSFDAHMLPRLLDLYRTMGFRFVPLAQAEADPYYASAIDPALSGPTASLAASPDTFPLAGPPAGLCN
ncbi:GDSL-type esterase/lipase family protein [uncultured Sphingomonas sp.]|uniref:GDSL-type esterase/lipase family protein n=1 Tax=uncultured Sphingomonas sp. TaxID=158754 RepID=UPI0035C9C382